MKKISSNKILSEKNIINKFFKRLSYNKSGTFEFENDAAYLNISQKYKTIVTTDTIIENVDFFSNDPPESLAQKLVCVNLSDLSAMGSLPKAYTLNISINSNVNYDWLKKFTKRLFYLQKKYKIYLVGGDISKSKEINISATFFGEAKLKYILSQNNCKLGDDIWVTGNLGNSFLGYKLLTNSNLKIDRKNFDGFKNKYLYPKPCMFGYIGSKIINAATDISDGFYGDLKKILNGKYGAKLKKNNIPILSNLKRVFLDNTSLINLDDILRWGDDYELIFTSNRKRRNKIFSLAKKNNVKLSIVGTIIKKKGIFDDSMSLIKNVSSFDHFC
jgi:thiamine-monophosphate kinase